MILTMRSGLNAALVLVALALPASAQDQQRSNRPGWPCVGTVDPSYVRTAEATGGAVLLFQPSELAGVATEMSASRGHDEIVFRAGAQLPEGVHEFEVPVDSAIASVYFFVSLQCLQAVSVIRPSGDELRPDAAGVTHHRFEAIRLYTIEAPTPGLWKVRVQGRGLFSLIVKAKTELRLTGVSFSEGGSPLRGSPTPGTSLRLEVTMSGIASEVSFQFSSSTAAMVQELKLDREQESELRRTYAGTVTAPSVSFRLAMTGIDGQGFRFQRVQNRLFGTDR
jgi:hypothetical protein